WTFVLWGAIHAIGRVATRDLGFLAALVRRLPVWAHRAGLFCFVTFAWIFFRAHSVGEGCLVVLRIFTSGFSDPHFPILLLIPIAIVWLGQLLEERKGPLLQAPAAAPA